MKDSRPSDELVGTADAVATNGFNASQAATSTEFVEGLIDRYTENLMRAAFSLGFPESDAEELVQATFVAFLDGGSRFKKRSQILTYLFGILYNKARESRRYRDRHDPLESPLDDRFESHFDAEEHWNREAEAQLSEVESHSQSAALGAMIEDCLNGLTAVMRMAFTMREVEQLDTQDICEALKLTSSHLGVTLFRARNRLRECLLAKGATLI